MEEMKNTYEKLVGNSEGKTQIGIHTCRCEDNIRMDLKKNSVGNCRLESPGS
jgi:hypothetical protein